MSVLPDTCLVDTNVPLTANEAISGGQTPEICVDACIEAIDHVTREGVLVLDEDGEIFEEYTHKLSFGNQPGMGHKFMKWVHDNQWNSQKVTRVSITKNRDTYNEFPSHEGLYDFDRSDRKFVAVANAHPEKPPILQATDSKWLKWEKALKDVGIEVRFLCLDYVREIYEKKFGS